jgi:hypothetical protein
VGSIRGTEEGPILKPEPKIKGGRKPKDAGKRYERSFSQKYGGKRVVGSGAFGLVDPTLQGDVMIKIGPLDMLLELKSLTKVDGRGQKIVNFPLAFLEKIEQEAKSIGKVPGLIYHAKGDTKEYLIVRFDFFKVLVEDYERQLEELEDRYDALLAQIGGVSPG